MIAFISFLVFLAGLAKFAWDLWRRLQHIDWNDDPLALVID